MRLKPFAGRRPLAAVAGILLGMVVAPVAAQAPELAMLDGLRDGAWEIHVWGEEARQRICVRNGRELIQIRHRNRGCSRYVVDDQPNQVTVHYACPGSGYGQTTIRKESPQLVQINSQGVEGRSPFSFTAEARRVGPC